MKGIFKPRDSYINNNQIKQPAIIGFKEYNNNLIITQILPQNEKNI